MDHTTLRLAAEDDAYTVRKLLVAARSLFDDAHLLCEPALPALLGIVPAVARGELPFAEWPNTISRAINASVPSPPPTAVRTIGELLQLLDAAVPAGAHDARVTRLLENKAMLDAPVLLQLLRGAMDSAAMSLTPLQFRLLCDITPLATPPLQLDGLIQERILNRLVDGAAAHEAADTKPIYWPRGDRGIIAQFLAAADLARRGDQRGSKHGCLLVEEEERCGACDDDEATTIQVLGAGWNHEVRERRGNSSRTRVLHAECHAIADAIRRHGEESAFSRFRNATAYIVELKDDCGYDDAPPCRKCQSLMRSVGVGKVAHSTKEGALKVYSLQPKPEWLRVEQACRPLAYALDDVGVRCERLEAALKESVARHPDLSEAYR